MNPIAKPYWRSIKRGVRTYIGIPEDIKSDVAALAAQEVTDGVLSQDAYDQIIGVDAQEDTMHGN